MHEVWPFHASVVEFDGGNPLAEHAFASCITGGQGLLLAFTAVLTLRKGMSGLTKTRIMTLNESKRVDTGRSTSNEI